MSKHQWHKYDIRQSFVNNNMIKNKMKYKGKK